MADLKELELGQAVDYVIEYNELHDQHTGERSDPKAKQDRPRIRKATQADWDAFWG